MLEATRANNRMEPSRQTVPCAHVAATRGSFGTLGTYATQRPWLKGLKNCKDLRD
jgi:hypothetical protein